MPFRVAATAHRKKDSRRRGGRLEQRDVERIGAIAQRQLSHGRTLARAPQCGGQSEIRPLLLAWHDEAFFVISGELKFRIGEGYRTAVAGESVFASRGLAHGFSNPQSQEARYLVALTPSGYEFYFERLAGLIRKHGAMPSQEELARLMAEHGTFLAAQLRSSLGQ
jgi:hypothetical protein